MKNFQQNQTHIYTNSFFEEISTEFVGLKEILDHVRTNKFSFFKAICNARKISSLTYAISLDIAIYFAETFRKNNNGSYWGFFTKPKNRMSVNRPVLLGFKHDMDLDPRIIVETCIWHSLDKKNEKLLYDTYGVWQNYVKENR